MKIENITMILLALIAAATDFMTYRISNKLIAIGMILGLICQVICNGYDGILIGLAGGAMPILCLGVFFVLRQFGAGDIKLLSVFGCFVGPLKIIYLTGFSIVIGGFIGAIKIMLYDNDREKIKIRFAIPIFISVLMYAGGLF